MRETSSNDVKSPRGAKLGNKGITTRIFLLHPSLLSLVIDPPLAGRQWLGHFHQVVSALDDSFSSLLVPPSPTFFAHQLWRCLMSLQVQHVLHPPLSLTPGSGPACFPFWHVICTLCPFVPCCLSPGSSARPIRLITVFPPDICHLFALCLSLAVSHCASVSLNLWQ